MNSWSASVSYKLCKLLIRFPQFLACDVYCLASDCPLRNQYSMMYGIWSKSLLHIAGDTYVLV